MLLDFLGCDEQVVDIVKDGPVLAYACKVAVADGNLFRLGLNPFLNSHFSACRTAEGQPGEEPPLETRRRDYANTFTCVGRALEPAVRAVHEFGIGVGLRFVFFGGIRTLEHERLRTHRGADKGASRCDIAPAHRACHHIGLGVTEARLESQLDVPAILLFQIQAAGNIVRLCPFEHTFTVIVPHGKEVVGILRTAGYRKIIPLAHARAHDVILPVHWCDFQPAAVHRVLVQVGHVLVRRQVVRIIHQVIHEFIEIQKGDFPGGPGYGDTCIETHHRDIPAGGLGGNEHHPVGTL